MLEKEMEAAAAAVTPRARVAVAAAMEEAGVAAVKGGTSTERRG